MFQNPFFHSLQTVMVFIQHFSGIVQIKIIFAVFIPREIEQCLTEGELNRIFSGCRIQPIKLSNLFFEKFGNFLAPFFVLAFCFSSLISCSTGLPPSSS